MDHAKKKQLKELKRKEKKQATMREVSGDHWKRYPLQEPEITCYRVGDLHADKQCSLVVLRRVPNGQLVYAAFLIDCGVIGLKEANGEAHASTADFNARLDEWRSRHALVRLSLDDARKLIASGARMRFDTGFRPVPNWERWASVLGGVGDWKNADTSQFIPEFAETWTYLERHLAGNADLFARRKDITFVWRDGDSPDGGLARPAASLEDWVSPEEEDVDEWFKAIERTPAAMKSNRHELREEMNRIGFEVGPHFSDLADACLASAAALLDYGRPPKELAIGSGVVGEITYFYFIILDRFDNYEPVMKAQVREAATVLAAYHLFLLRKEAHATGKSVESIDLKIFHQLADALVEDYAAFYELRF